MTGSGRAHCQGRVGNGPVRGQGGGSGAGRKLTVMPAGDGERSTGTGGTGMDLGILVLTTNSESKVTGWRGRTAEKGPACCVSEQATARVAGRPGNV